MSAKKKKSQQGSVPVVETPKPIDPTPVVPNEVAFDQKAYEEVNTLEVENKLESSNKVLYRVGTGVVLGIIVCALVIFGLWTKTPMVGQENVTLISPTVPPVLASPTTVAFDRSSITFEVRNGSGVPGAAAAVAQKLKEKGYTVVSIGNAKEQVVTALFTSLSSPQLLEDVALLFKVSTVSGKLLDSTVSARLILGTP